MRLNTDAQSLQLASSLLERTCHVPAVRATSAYLLYVINNVVVVRFGSASAQRCGQVVTDPVREQSPAPDVD
jgi:hypothetical protein